MTLGSEPYACRWVVGFFACFKREPGRYESAEWDTADVYCEDLTPDFSVRKTYPGPNTYCSPDWTDIF